MPLKTELTIRLRPTLTKVLGGQTLSEMPEFFRALTLLTGVVLNQADKLYYSKPTIAGSATLTLDLIGGGLVDVYGDAFGPARLKVILINSDLAVCPNVITLQRPAANGLPLFGAASGSLPVRPGGGLLWWAPDLTGVLVTAGTGDLLDLVNTAGGNVQPDVYLIGASA